MSVIDTGARQAADAVQFEDLAPVLLRAGEKVARERTRHFEEAKRMGSDRAYSKSLGFANDGRLGPDGGAAASAPIKFAVHAAEHVDTVRLYLPQFAGVKKAFEIGVGAGYLMRALIDVAGIDVTGCDIETEKSSVYVALRRELGLLDRVIEHRVVYRQPIPIPEGADTVIAFLPAFDVGWLPQQYDWLHEECFRKGVSRVFWRLNAKHSSPRARDYFLAVGAFPVRGDQKRFVIVQLRPRWQRQLLRAIYPVRRFLRLTQRRLLGDMPPETRGQPI